MLRRTFVASVLVCLALTGTAPASFPFVDDAVFSRHLQAKALSASCKVTSHKGSSGTGTLIERDARGGLILTASHVCEGKVPALVEFYTASSWPAPARAFATLSLVADDPGGDLALVRLDTKESLPEPIRLCPQSLLPGPRFRAFTVGCNEGHPTLLQGRAIDLRLMTTPAGQIFELDFPAYPGRSGGPLIDEHGLLVGVCYGSTRSRTAPQGIYPSAAGIYRLCDSARRPDLYQGAPDPTASVLLILVAKVLFARLLFTFVLRHKGAA